MGRRWTDQSMMPPDFMGKVSRLVLGELLTAHLIAMQGFTERMGEFLTEADRAALADLVRSTMRLNETMEASDGR